MPPILVANLLPEVCQRLHELLRSLGQDEWALPTSSSQRTVKDIASHLLDGSLRRLSMQRDGYPCFDIFMRALPFAYRHVEAPLGSLVTITITGAAGGSWHIARHAHGWRQIATPARAATATVTVGQDAAWKVLTKRRSREAKLQQFPEIQFAGDELLASHFLDVVSVMA